MRDNKDMREIVLVLLALIPVLYLILKGGKGSSTGVAPASIPVPQAPTYLNYNVPPSSTGAASLPTMGVLNQSARTNPVVSQSNSQARLPTCGCNGGGGNGLTAGVQTVFDNLMSYYVKAAEGLENTYVQDILALFPTGRLA